MVDVAPTNPRDEAAQGRAALWLAPENLRWLAQHGCCPDDASQEVTDRCGRLRFRAGAALHKHGQSH
ncbi:hypothetical protein GCM10010431_67020 [Streptomyces kunmingensis]